MHNWRAYLPARAVVSRFFKYLFLLLALVVNLKIVFDGFSYYLARRGLDAELEAKKVSSLEYLVNVSKRERALVIDTIQTRCRERNELALFRVGDAVDAKLAGDLHTGYIKSREMRNHLFATTVHLERDRKDLAALVNLPDLRATVNGLTFSLANLMANTQTMIKPAQGVKKDDPAFRAAADEVFAALLETAKPFLAVLQSYGDLLKRIHERYGEESTSLGSIAILEQRLVRLKKARDENRTRAGADLSDVLDRYAAWTSAISGGASDSPILDEMAIRIDDDSSQAIGKVNCDNLNKFYSKITGTPFNAADLVEKGDAEVGFFRNILAAPGRIAAFYSEAVSNFFRSPPVAQTLFVTLFLGALGALTINVLRLSKVGWWGGQLDPAWGEVMLSPLLGALAAFGIFLLGSSGLLLTSDAKSGSAAPLSAFFIGMLGFISGLLYDEAFGRVRRFGSQLFAGDSPVVVTGPEDRSLAETLRTAKASFVADLVLKFGLGKRIADEAEFTLLVPSDDAMSRLTLQAWKEISEPTTRSKFENWFRHHHAVKRVVSRDVASGSVTELEVEDGSKYPLAVDQGSLKINNAKVAQADITWRNGVIHVLEQGLG